MRHHPAPPGTRLAMRDVIVKTSPAQDRRIESGGP
jgi:hypothetical protein